MNILLDKAELELLLERRKAYIGKEREGLFDSLFAAVTFLFSWLYTECQDVLFIKGSVIKGIYLVITLAFLGRGIVLMIKKNNYTAKKLNQEINELNRMEHPFSIIGICDTYNAYANRFLLYYDSRWKCYLFPNGRTQEDSDRNEEQLKRDISRALKVPESTLSIEKTGERIHQKYSVSDREMKWYHHTFYWMKVEEFPEEARKTEFVIEGMTYRWMTIAEMEKDKRIQEVNGDVVAIVKELYR